MEIKVGDTVHTPRFLAVKIEKVFPTKREMYAEGFNEPTHFSDEAFEVCGKAYKPNYMIFAAARK